MVRRRPGNKGPSDINPSGFLQGLVNNDLRADPSIGVKKIKDMMAEINPARPQSEAQYQPPSPEPFAGGDPRKLAEDVDYMAIVNAIANMAQEQENKDPIISDVSPPPPARIDDNQNGLLSSAPSPVIRARSIANAPKENSPANVESDISPLWNPIAQAIERQRNPNGPIGFIGSKNAPPPEPTWLERLEKYNDNVDEEAAALHKKPDPLPEKQEISPEKPGFWKFMADSLHEMDPETIRGLKKTEPLDAMASSIKEASVPPSPAPSIKQGNPGVVDQPKQTRPAFVKPDKNASGVGRQDAPIGMPQSVIKAGNLMKEQGEIPKEPTEILQQIKQIPPENLEPDSQAIAMIQENPEIKAKVEEIVGMPLSEEMMEEAKSYGDVLNGTLDNIDDNRAKILERMENDELTNTDMMMIGLAVLAPALLAAVTGGGMEVALGGFAPASEKLMGLYDSKEKNRRDDLDKLSELDLKKADVLEKKSRFDMDQKKFEMEQRKLAPGFTLSQRMAGRPKQQFGDQVGIETTKGSPLWIDDDSIHTERDYDHVMEKVVPEAQKELGTLKATNNNMNKALDVIDQVGDLGLWDQTLATASQRLGPTVTIKDENGEREVNAVSQLNGIIGKLSGLYLRSMKYRTPSENALAQASEIMENPFKPESLRNTTLANLREQILNMKDMMNDEFIEMYTNQGFLREPLEQAVRVRNVSFAPSKADQKANQSKADQDMWSKQNVADLRKKVV